jgi:hypothetical protein
MDFSATIDLIIKELKEASDIIDDLKKYPGVPVLQVELAKMKCKSAAEVISILKSLKEDAALVEKVPVKEKIVQKIRKEEEPRPQPAPEIIPPETKPAGTGKIIKIEQESPSIADQFSQPASSLIEQLSPVQTEEEIADILKTKPITSLTEAIGINDKFLFIREIFHGNHNDYNAALSRLEDADNLTDARAVIMSYTGDSSESEAVMQLLNLVKRKLPSDE